LSLHPRNRFPWQLLKRTLQLGKKTLLMGILNVTPDSFSERGRFFDQKAAIARGGEIEREGADILDIGGESTRPGALPVSEEEELDRTIPVIEALKKKGLRIPISIDTYKYRVAERALEAGAEIVNDVSGLRYDASLAEVVARHRAGVVLMHLRGTPQTMQQLPPVRGIVPTVRRGLSASLRKALQAGIRKRQIVLDPGIGFGKTAGQSFELLHGLRRFASLGYPILVGPSRKSFIRAALIRAATGRERATSEEQGTLLLPDELLFGTAAAVTAAILNGAHIVRVHDVREMLPVVRIADKLLFPQ
jgi:dihydropteroate synthase